MKKTLIAMVLVIIIAFGLYLIFAPGIQATDVMAINYTFRVGEKITINLDTDKLHFGGGPPGATLQRRMNVSAPYDALVKIESAGPGAITANKNDFMVLENEPLEVEFVVNIPYDLPLGDYEGTVFVYFYD